MCTEILRKALSHKESMLLRLVQRTQRLYLLAVGTAEQMDLLRIGGDDVSPQQLMEAANNWAKRNNFSPEQLQVYKSPFQPHRMIFVQ